MNNSHYHTVIFTHKKTGQVLRRFDYPSKKIPGKFFWEKIKLEELTKILKTRDLSEFDVKMTDYSGTYVTNN